MQAEDLQCFPWRRLLLSMASGPPAGIGFHSGLEESLIQVSPLFYSFPFPLTDLMRSHQRTICSSFRHPEYAFQDLPESPGWVPCPADLQTQMSWVGGRQEKNVGVKGSIQTRKQQRAYSAPSAWGHLGGNIDLPCCVWQLFRELEIQGVKHTGFYKPKQLAAAIMKYILLYDCLGCGEVQVVQKVCRKL